MLMTTHDAKRNSESNGNQHEHRSKAQTKKHRLYAGVERAPPIDRLYCRCGSLSHLRITLDEGAVGGFLDQSPQFVQDILAEAAAERRNSGETRLRIRAIQRN
jgi:hypothetical protein